MRVRNGDDADIGWSNCIKAGKNSSTHQSQGKTLITVAVIITAGQNVALSQVLVNLADHAVYAVVGRSGAKKVVAVGVRRLIGGGPGIPGQQTGNHRIHHSSIRGNCLIELVLRGNGGDGGKAHILSLSLIGHKPERLVFYKRPAQRESILVVLE